MIRRPPISTRTDTLFPYTTLFRSDSGTRQVVLVETGPGRFAPRDVTLGRRGGDRVEVLGGIAEGEQVVVSANFLRSEEHTSELQSLMRTSYAVFCLKKKTNKLI